MSLRSWTVDGFGIEVDLLDVGSNKKKAFIKKHDPEFWKEVESYAKEEGLSEQSMMENLDDLFPALTEEVGGFAVVFSRIMSDETGITFEAQVPSEDGYGAIMYRDCAPWEMEEKVRNMSYEDMEEIFAKYLAEIGVKEFDFERQSIEYYG